MNSIENTENKVPSKTNEYNSRDNFLKILEKDVHLQAFVGSLN